MISVHANKPHVLTNGAREDLCLPNVARSCLYKTELCKGFLTTGSCRYGSKCQFAHGLNELKQTPRHPKYKTERCKNFWATGYCPYGKKCRFVHDEPAGNAPPPSELEMLMAAKLRLEREQEIQQYQQKLAMQRALVEESKKLAARNVELELQLKAQQLQQLQQMRYVPEMMTHVPQFQGQRFPPQQFAEAVKTDRRYEPKYNDMSYGFVSNAPIAPTTSLYSPVVGSLDDGSSVASAASSSGQSEGTVTLDSQINTEDRLTDLAAIFQNIRL
eukprot:TRINITY_DN3106_c0_g1_i1.p1 TRINITY_DN3106_c0_g1~~TRINITY_DN3106_c0_g1_i1.p1  ORF type:complete len:291 (+),score=93.77 TRINITY_DN3106_c0_g1_i1:55-873(+)